MTPAPGWEASLWGAHLGYALGWLLFAAGHSLLATLTGRALLHRLFGAGGRLAYTIFATVHAATLWSVGRFMLFAAAPPAPVRPMWLMVAQGSMVVAGIALFVIGLYGYDLARFLGLRQLLEQRGAVPQDDEPELQVGGLNRHVRHPLYLGGLLVLWGGAVDMFEVTTAVWASLYIVVGMQLEERKLLRLYGAPYRVYQTRVPALIPYGLLFR